MRLTLKAFLIDDILNKGLTSSFVALVANVSTLQVNGILTTTSGVPKQVSTQCTAPSKSLA
jgi:hypothetical protein